MKKLHYGWYVVIAAAVIIGMTAGVINNCFSQFIKPVCADMGFTRQQMSLNQTIVSVVAMAFGLCWGSISKRIRLHRWMCAAALLLPACYFCYSFTWDLWSFYAVTCLLAVVFCFISMMIFTYVVGNWFHRDRGFALGLSSMGSGVGAMIMNSLINMMIQSVGWRQTYQITALLMVALILPLTVFVIRVKPEDKGMTPYGAGESTGQPGAPAAARAEGYTFQEVARMPLFYIVAGVTGLLILAICIFFYTMTPHLSDVGYSATFAAAMASVASGALALGKVVLGKVFDLFGARKASAAAGICSFLGLMGMIFPHFFPSMALIVLGVGMGCSFGAICLPVIVQKLFGMKDYNAIYGKLTAVTGAGGAAAPIVAGWTFDTFGSYMPIYYLCAATVLVCTWILWKKLPENDMV